MTVMREQFKAQMNKPWTLFFGVILLFWLKTYAVYQTEFELGIKNGLQSFLLILNPISSLLFFFGFALFFKGRKRAWAILIIDFLLSFVLYANVVYYRFFNDFITLPTVMHTNDAGELKDSAFALMNFTDVFYFVDTLLILGLILFKVVKPQAPIKRKKISLLFASAAVFFIVNLGLAETDRPELLTRSFDRTYLVKYLGQFNYQIFDAITTIKSNSQSAFASSDDLTDVRNFVEANRTEPNPEYFGKAEGKNVIYISLESFQTFVIGKEVNGQEVTPFLNSLVEDQNTFYFDNIFGQVGQGKTSDAEFMMANSLYSLPSGSVAMEKARNTYHAQPAILEQRGYTTSSFHGNGKTFWNRDEMYKSFGIQKFFDSSYYDMSEENVHNYGLKDKPFFEESMPYLENLEEPFHAKMLTLSNHFPFTMDEGDVDFPTPETEDSVVNGYFQTAKYMDESIEQFFNDLKESGLYEDTVIVMYGDHYGISNNHNKAMEKVMGKEMNPYENAQMQRVPVFITAPGVEGKQVHKYGGQIDIRDTVLHLLGVETDEFISFGSDLLSEDHREIVPFRNGDFVTPEVTSVNEKCYANPTGEKVDSEACENAGKYVKETLDLSDKVVYGDLLRFYDPEGFTPVDRNDYNYNVNQIDPEQEAPEQPKEQSNEHSKEH
ncbi:LTA synthase family protein [Guptibacillus hwajinpoensis]|uniref:Glycerol phosphate lipoteichoic acid synthase n=1 Tax=Guptibacillus hwajinpoensis TaxID=208199 RepID=A0A0J6CT34_9BACL|nr:LTA synthase family protein [Alkalihalobacillus macyae]KMM39476.1 glycerol phosphate lipoteichoic acid synthase [Alkalihalobacillus macyae]